MIFNTEENLFSYIERNKETPAWILEARENHTMLKALVEGENFENILIKRIEFLEDDDKALARKKYSRNIVDLFERLLRPLDNIYTSTGGAKHYHNLSDVQIDDLTSHLDSVRGDKGLETWLKDTWLKTLHTDPSGIVYLEYDAVLGIKPQPCYKSINTIRNYMANGQRLEVLLFEPKKIKSGNQWTVVDSKSVYTINEIGDAYTIVDQFDHEFGVVPAVINSTDEHIGYEDRLSPLSKVLAVATEYCRDLSSRTIYKALAATPRRWRFEDGNDSNCPACHGLGQDGEGNSCSTCGGSGHVRTKSDVTTEDILAIPEDGQSSIVPPSGYVSPDLAFLSDSRIEQKELEDLIFETHWGAIIDTQASATATEIVVNTQPITMRLNSYSDKAQKTEALLTEMIANHLFLAKNKDEKVASIHYGRNFIIESLDSVLTRYENAKEKSDNSIILDRLYHEYLLTKFSGDEVGLNLAILKSKVEPYIHYNSEQLFDLMGKKEAAKQIMFGDWWKNIDTLFDKTKEQLLSEYNTYFEAEYKAISKVDDTEVTETE